MTKLSALLRQRASSKRHARALVTIIIGALLLLTTSYIHWHLWDALGYRHVPTIGWLFLLQAISGLVLALVVVLVREFWTAILGAGFVASTVAGFLITVTRGLFGFQDSWLAPYARTAFIVETAAFVVLIAGAFLIWLDSRPVN
ncbi:MAG TPA: hypothetical protein VGE75_01795 [Acidimicrobiales bacterium]